MPWRSIRARSAARLRRIVGPLSRHGACRTGEPLTSFASHGAGHIRTYPDISGHIRTARHRGVKKDRRVPYRPSPDRVPYRRSPDRVPSGSSRAVSPVAGSRAVRFVACRIARRQTRRRGWSSCGIARRRARQRGWSVMCRMACRRIACRMARHRIASRHVPARVGDPGVSAVVTVGRAERPSSAMSRPNMAL